jgi:hypothetical protein
MEKATIDQQPLAFLAMGLPRSLKYPGLCRSYVAVPLFHQRATFSSSLSLRFHTLTMPPIAGAPRSASHKRKAMYTNAERSTRSHARDPSQTSMDRGRSTPQKPDVDKELPVIPSPTTGLRGLEPVMGALPRHKRRPLKVEVSFCLPQHQILLVSPLRIPQHHAELTNTSC